MIYENKTVKRFSGFASEYLKYRPRIPQPIIEIILMTYGKRPKLVVDLGSGTGDSTIPWSDYSERVIGIEPSTDMLEIAKISCPSNVEYMNRFGNDTGLEEKSADIILCSSSLHWMEPISTANEIERILKPSGVFSSFGYYFPYICQSWLLSKKIEEWRINGEKYRLNHKEKFAEQFDLNETIIYFKSRCLFSYLRKIYLHSTEEWNIEDFVGYINLYPDLANSERNGLTEIAYKEFGKGDLKVVFTYSLWIGIKS